MKPSLTRFALFAIIALVNLNPPGVSASQVSAVCDEITLPAQVNELLRVRFSGWRPKSVSDIDADDRQLWLKAHDKECPGIVVGRFENGDPSYATLLVPKEAPTGGYKLVVFSRDPKGNTYGWKLLDHADGQTYSGLVISKAKPGKYSDYGDAKSVQTSLDGVYLEWIEKGAQLYYWSSGRYHRLQVSD